MFLEIKYNTNYIFIDPFSGYMCSHTHIYFIKEVVFLTFWHKEALN